MKVGDLIKKKVGADSGRIAVILTVVDTEQQQFAEVMTLDGGFRHWYTGLAEVIGEGGRSSEAHPEGVDRTSSRLSKKKQGGPGGS